MTIESDADRSVYIDTDGFAQNVTIDGATVAAIFDSPYLEALEVDGEVPVLTVRSVDVASVVHGSVVVVDSTGYQVVSVQADGTGMTVLRLQET
jgi:hypothetical protein